VWGSNVIARSNMETVNVFAEMDKQLTGVLETFEEIAAQVELEIVGDLKNDALIRDQVYPGIYLVEIETSTEHGGIKEWVNWFKAEWDHERYAKRFVPTTKKKRIKGHRELKQWMPIYLGKSKRIASRVIEHVHLELDRPTFAMKLKARGDFFTKHSFQLSTAHIDIAHYDLIMPMVERSLRRRLNPIVGKQ
jgi:hypothetical protein